MPGPLADPLAMDYTLRILAFNTSTGDYDVVETLTSLSAGDFPFEVPNGVDASRHYVSTIEAVVADGARRSVAFFGVTAPPVGEWFCILMSSLLVQLFSLNA